MCAGPLTWPQIKRLSWTSFTVKLAYGFPLAVGIDISTTQCRKDVIDAGTVALEADAGSMIWRP